MIPFNYHHLYYFHTIARCGSVTAACKELRLAQPTLSTQLKRFEDYLNVKLFVREGKKLRLTDHGRYVLSYANDIFDTGKEFVDGLADLSRRQGRISIQIGAYNFIPRSFMDALIRYLFRLSPGVHLSVQEGDASRMLEELRSHRLDLILTDAPEGGARQQEIESHLVGKIPIVFCAHPSLAGKYTDLPRNLDGAPMILPTAHSRVYHAVQEYLIVHKIEPEIVAEVQDVETARRMALAGLGVAPLNVFTASHAPGSEQLSVLGKRPRLNIFDNLYILTKKRKRPHPLVPAILKDFKIPV